MPQDAKKPPGPPDAQRPSAPDIERPSTPNIKQTWLQKAKRSSSADAQPPSSPDAKRPSPADARRGPQDKLSAVRELFQLIDMAVKTLNLYEGKGESCELAIDKAFGQLAATVRRFGELEVSVRPFEFSMGRQRVYTTQEDRRGITYGIFRDGIRKLRFMPMVDRREFVVLLETLRAIRTTNTASGEHDSVTMLWEQNLEGIRYDAVDYFLEGSIRGCADDLQGQVDELYAQVSRPLHALPSTKVAQQLRERLDAEIIEQARQKRAEFFSSLEPGLDQQNAVADIEGQRWEMPIDLWRRSMTLITRLLTAEGSGVAALLVQIIEQLMLAGRWELLEASCKTLSEHLEQARKSSDGLLTRSLQDALGQLCLDNKLLALYERLASCSAEEFFRVGELIKILPKQADQQLQVLLRRLPDGEIQALMLRLLTDRGVDLTDFLRQRLRSDDLKVVVAAIGDLRTINTGSAVAALKSVTGHADPAIRLEVFRALGENVGESLAPRLFDSLRIDHPQLRQLCLDLLERIGSSRHRARLLATVKSGLGEDWRQEDRARLLGILVGCGGDEIDSYIVETITVKNTFRRSSLESQRQRMLQAVRDSRADRAGKLLHDCLQKRLPRRLRKTIEQALRSVQSVA